MKAPIHQRPRVVVSKCLGFEACRWNQAMIQDRFVQGLGEWVDYLPVCPEVDSGMGVPRDPVRLVEGEGRIRLIQPATGRDWTEEMGAFAGQFLGSLQDVDGFMLKSRSPSCGPMDVKVYSGLQPGAASRKGRGLFADKINETYGWAAVEHEGRVKNLGLREHFLTKIFTLAAFRGVRAKKIMGALVNFQAANKLLLMAYNQSRLRVMGPLVANPRGRPVAEVLDAYAEQLHAALAQAPQYTANINVLMHAYGYFSKELTAGEKAHFLDLLDEYRAGRVLLGTLQALLWSWIVRFEQQYLAGQTFFAPYPAELIDLTDSGKAREVKA